MYIHTDHIVTEIITGKVIKCKFIGMQVNVGQMWYKTSRLHHVLFWKGSDPLFLTHVHLLLTQMTNKHPKLYHYRHTSDFNNKLLCVTIHVCVCVCVFSTSDKRHRMRITLTKWVPQNHLFSYVHTHSRRHEWILTKMFAVWHFWHMPTTSRCGSKQINENI